MKVLRQALLLSQKDLALELKSKQVVPSMVMFSGLLIVIFSFAFNPAQNSLAVIIPGLIWVITLFSGVLGLNRTFQAELQNEMMSGLLLAPVSPASLFLGKLFSNLVFVLVVQFLSLPFLFLLFDLRWSGNFLLFGAVLFIGTFGFITAGTFLSALTVQMKGNELLLPILLFPLITPVVIAAVRAGAIILLEPELTVNVFPWLKLIIGFDVIFFILCLLLFEFIVEA